MKGYVELYWRNHERRHSYRALSRDSIRGDNGYSAIAICDWKDYLETVMKTIYLALVYNAEAPTEILGAYNTEVQAIERITSVKKNSENHPFMRRGDRLCVEKVVLGKDILNALDL